MTPSELHNVWFYYHYVRCFINMPAIIITSSVYFRCLTNWTIGWEASSKVISLPVPILSRLLVSGYLQCLISVNHENYSCCYRSRRFINTNHIVWICDNTVLNCSAVVLHGLLALGGNWRRHNSDITVFWAGMSRSVCCLRTDSKAALHACCTERDAPSLCC